MVWIAIVSFLGSFGCGGAPKLQTGDAPADYRRPIYKVVIDGNNVFSDDEIISGLVNQGSTGWWLWRNYNRFDPAELSKDAERIVGFYRQHGYFSASVKSIKSERLIGGAVQIAFVVDEQKASRIADVSIEFVDEPEGRFADSTSALRRDIRQETLIYECCRYHTRRDDVFDHSKYLVAKAKLVRFMLNLGYAHAKVDGVVSVDREEHTSVVTFSIDPGPKVLFGDTKIVGLKEMPPSVVANRIVWEKGEVFSQKKIEETRGRLLRLGRFNTVTIEMPKQKRDVVARILIRVVEQGLHEIRLGGGAALDTVQWELRSRAEYTKSNFFFDPLSSLRVRLKPAYRWLRTDENQSGFAGEGELSLERTDFVLPLITGATSISYAVERYESYTTAGPSFRLTVERPLWRELIYIGFAWNLSQLNFPSLSSVLDENEAFRGKLGVDDEYRLGVFEESITFDFRDSAISPRLGFYVSGELEQGTSYAGGLIDYSSGQVDIRGYVPVSKRAVLAARMRYSRLITGNALPLTKRYYAGGASSHRGFPQRRITPTISATRQDGSTATAFIGGDVRFESSLELRYDLLPVLEDWFSVVGFFDAGDVGESKYDLRLDELHIATGFGLRIGTPIGPIRADVGVRTNRVGGDADVQAGRFAFHLGIGEAF